MALITLDHITWFDPARVSTVSAGSSYGDTCKLTLHGSDSAHTIHSSMEDAVARINQALEGK